MANMSKETPEVGKKGGLWQKEEEYIDQHLVEGRNNPGGELAEEEAQEYDISGRLGGPKLPHGK